MKIVVKKEEFLKQLNYAVNFISIKNLGSILNNILITTEDNYISLKSTDIQTGFISRIKADILESGEITVSCRKILEIVKELPDDGNIDIQLVENRVHITCGKSKFQLQTIQSDDFPILQDIEQEHRVIIESEVLEDILKKISFCISSDMTKIEYTGAHLTVSGNTLTISSSDYFRIASASTKISSEYSDEFTINIPRKTILELQKIINEDEYVEIISDGKAIQIKIGEICIYSSLIEKYIKTITKLFDNEYPLEAEIDRDKFIDCIRRVSVVAQDINKIVNINFFSEKMDIFTIENELGQGEEELDGIKFSGEEIGLSFNSKHMLEILQKIDTDTVVFKLEGRNKPALLLPKDKENHKYLLVALSIAKS